MASTYPPPREQDALDLFADSAGMPPVYKDIRNRLFVLGSLMAAQAARISELEARIKDLEMPARRGDAERPHWVDEVLMVMRAIDIKLAALSVKR